MFRPEWTRQAMITYNVTLKLVRVTIAEVEKP